MSVAEIARRLEDRFALLTGGDRVGARAAPDAGGGDRLELEPARRARNGRRCAALAVFPDGFSLDGADAVLGRDALGLGRRAGRPVARGRARGRRRALPAAGDGARVRPQAARRRRRDRRGPRRGCGRGPSGWRATLLARLFSPDQVAVMDAVRAEVGNLAGVMRAALADSRRGCGDATGGGARRVLDDRGRAPHGARPVAPGRSSCWWRPTRRSRGVRTSSAACSWR